MSHGSQGIIQGLCYCTKFQENKKPDKEDTTLKKKENKKNPVAYVQPLAVASASAVSYVFVFRFLQSTLRH